MTGVTRVSGLIAILCVVAAGVAAHFVPPLGYLVGGVLILSPLWAIFSDAGTFLTLVSLPLALVGFFLISMARRH